MLIKMMLEINGA